MKFLRILLVLLVCGVLLSAAGLYLIVHWASRDLPGFQKITDYRPPLVTTVYSSDNHVLGYFYREKRFLARLDQMSPWLPKAFLAAEDSGFYQHEGVDITAILRAALINLKSGHIRQGGSTITQQIIKRLLLTSERSYERKLKEAILAYRLEHYLTKDEILTIYLNQIFLGSNAYGVEAAAREYFGKHVNELTLAECAILAGLPQAPSRYSPNRDPELAKNRQKYVLERMFEMGWINRAQFEEALAQPLVYKGMPDISWKVGPYYLEEVRRWLIDKFGEDMVYEGGLHVSTPCDLTHQAAADAALKQGLLEAAKRRGWDGPVQHLEQHQFQAFLGDTDYTPEDIWPGRWIKVLVTAVAPTQARVQFGRQQGIIPASSMGWCRTPNPRRAPEDVPKVTDATRVLKRGDVVWATFSEKPSPEKGVHLLDLERLPGPEGALVSIKPDTGEVVALSGGFSFELSQFNRATQALRQPGSAFKPLVYSTAIDNGFTAASIVLDAPIVFENVELGKIWKPENYEGIFYGPTLLRTALVKSRNLVTIRVAQKIGIRRIIERAKAMGLTADLPEDLSVALGSGSVSLLNLCQAYTPFARGGTTIKPVMVRRVLSAWGEELYRSEPEIKDAISPQTAFIMATLMKDVVQYGTGWRAKELGRPVAGKTGTSNDEHDAWFMAYTPYLLTGVWVGYDQLQPMGRLETGSRTASPIWVYYRKQVEDKFPYQDFEQPPGVVMVHVDAKNGLLAGPGTTEDLFLPFKEGTQPTEVSRGGGDVSSGGGASGSEEDLFKQVY
ncbi:PBP1A family penicillin-binding protein [Desulfovibrio aminophilus]|nr:PBP1A family penicillin-binding protein [Desulfovibrio aminophilus]MCM0754146.1 PBP1A family penicillin-binding protein [Desulfovibrio aminophilus]